MIPIIFFYVVIELPADIVRVLHRLVRGENFVPANKWIYRFLGMLMVCITLAIGLALTEHG